MFEKGKNINKIQLQSYPDDDDDDDDDEELLDDEERFRRLRFFFSFFRFRFFFFSFFRRFFRLRSSRLTSSTRARSDDASSLGRFCASAIAMGSSRAMRDASKSTLPVVARGHSRSPVL